MEHKFVKYIHEFFKKLIELYGFRVNREVNDGQSYTIEFSSSDFVIRIDKYFREFYPTIYKLKDFDNAMNLFNLLEYLCKDSTSIPRAEYFKKEKILDESYRKQIEHISSVIYNSYDAINDFFNAATYDSNIIEFENFWRIKHPELYQKNN